MIAVVYVIAGLDVLALLIAVAVFSGFSRWYNARRSTKTADDGSQK